MPVEFDEFDTASDDIEWAVDPDSTSHAILPFHFEQSDMEFPPAEIHEARGIMRGCVGTTPRQLEEGGPRPS